MEGNKFHPAFEFLLARVASNPEEFTARPSRWAFAIVEANRIGSAEEKAALETAINALSKEVLYENIMRELMNNEDDKEDVAAKTRIGIAQINPSTLRAGSSTPSYSDAYQREIAWQHAATDRVVLSQQAANSQDIHDAYGTQNTLSKLFGGKK